MLIVMQHWGINSSYTESYSLREIWETGIKNHVTIDKTIEHIPNGWLNLDIRLNAKLPKVPSKWVRDKGNGLNPYVITTENSS